ncbi:MAG: type II secretion system protein [Lentisphaerae bacterium]|nr:type II secretion system protein [Lentisphaerota bacterium]
MKSRRQRLRKAFTLIELLAVIGIIIVLVGIVMAGAGYANRAADRAKARSQLEMIQTALDRYNTTYTRYPPSKITYKIFTNMLSFVPDLTNHFGWQTNQVTKGLEFLDPWNQPIWYQKYKDDSCILRSFGPDGVSNTVDDIVTMRGE